MNTDKHCCLKNQDLVENRRDSINRFGSIRVYQCLCVFICGKNAEAGEFGEEIGGGGEMEARDAEAGCGDDIFAEVVDKHGFLWQGVDFAKRVMVDNGRWLARPDTARIYPHGKVTDERECSLEMCHVNRIGIRKQCEMALRREALEQKIGQDRVRFEDAIPNCAEFVKVVGKLEFFREARVPFARRHTAFLPIRPPRIRFQFTQNLQMRQSIGLSNGSKRPGKLNADDHPADVKDDSARRFLNRGAKERHG